MFKRRVLSLATAIPVFLLVTSISNPAFSATLSKGEAFPLTLQSGGVVTVIPQMPKRIISLSPTATEILFAENAGAQVIAVDSLSNYPTNAPITKLSAFSPNVEAIASKRPDLVTLSADATNSVSIQKSLRLLKIAVLVEKAPTQISGAYSEFITIGKATNHVNDAKLLVSRVKNSINSIIEKSRKKNLVTFFHELDNTLYSATSSTFIGHVYSSLGLKNIADRAQGADASGYPQLSQEYLVTTNPQIIFLSDAQYGENLQTVSARPGWAQISAVMTSNVVLLPADITSRWGPRLVDFYQSISDAMAKVA